MRKLNITFCSFPDYSGNAKVLYEYMKKRYNGSMIFTWIINDIKNIKILEDYKDVKVILIGTNEFRNYINTTDVFFTTHANLAGDKRASDHAIYVELWHGIGPKPVGFLTHNLSEQDRNWYNFLSETIDYFIAPSELWRILFSTMFGINVNRVKSLGMPLLDEIKLSNGRKNLGKLLNVDVNKYDKIIMYMPTFKKSCGRKLESKFSESNILNFYDYNDDDLIKYLKKNNYLLVVKRHPSDECIYKTIENDFIKNIDNYRLCELSLNVNNILNAGDLLITDYSSLGVEFSVLNKPVIYISTDLEEYKKNRGIIFDDYSFWTGGLDCDNYKDMIKLIDEKIGKPYVYANQHLMYDSLQYNNCKKICDYFFDDGKLRSCIKRYESSKYLLEDEIVQIKKDWKLDKENCDKELEMLKIKMEKKIEKMNYEIKVLTESKLELDQIKNSRSWKWFLRIKKIIKH